MPVTDARADSAFVRPADPLLDDLPLPAFLLDDAQRVVGVNAEFERLCGRPEAELAGRNVAVLLPRDELPRVLQALARSGRADALAQRQSWRLAIRDGGVLAAEVAFRPVTRDGWRGVLAIVAAARSGPPAAIARVSVGDAGDRGTLLESFFAFAPTGCVIVDERGRVVLVNRAYAELTGWAVSDLIGRTDLQVPPEDEAGEREALQRHLRSAPGSVLRSAGRLLTREGCVLTVERASTWIGDHTGKRVRLTTVADLAPRLAADDELRRLLQQQGALLQAMAAGVMIVVDGRVVRCNRSLELLLGMGAESMLGRRVEEVLDADRSWTAIREAGVPAGPGDCVYACEIELRRPGREPVGCALQLRQIDPANIATGHIVTLQDLSELRRQQSSLRRAIPETSARDPLSEGELRFVHFAEAVEEAVMIVDAEAGRAIYANARVAEVLGVDAEVCLRQPEAAWRHVDPRDRPRLDELLGRALRAGHHETDVRVGRAGDAPRMVRVRLFRAGPELCVMAEDVTEPRRAAQRRVDEAIRQRDTLVREVHHRIKNNLQGVAGLLQQAASRRPDLAHPLEEVVGQIQAIAQVHGIQVRDEGDLSVARLVRAVLENLARGFGHAVEPLGPVSGDVEAWTIPEQEAVPLALVVNELGTNAIKHSRGDAPVRGALAVEGDALVLRVSNAGSLAPGFSLFSLDPAPSGLSLVKALLPRRGAQLSLTEIDGRVVAELRLGPPTLRPGPSGNMEA